MKLAGYFQSGSNQKCRRQGPRAFTFETNYQQQDILQIAKVCASEKPVFLSAICVVNGGNMCGTEEGLCYFEFEAEILAQNHRTQPVTVISYTAECLSVFVVGYCKFLISKQSACRFVDQYMELVEDLVERT
ncbi:hypothetical protein [Microbulbifer variabilis]|uniref:hypothetical protein n=1 Tax=Microbulbifer variabilis TaxID=266805 RepID=UPI00035EA758|nr:hypothetical protein [Microbulbifer variabilis]